MYRFTFTTIIIFLFFISSGNQLMAKHGESLENYQSLQNLSISPQAALDSAIKYRNDNYLQSLYFIAYGNQLLDKNENLQIRIEFVEMEGLIWYQHFNFEKAIKAFMLAAEIHTLTEDHVGLGYANLNIGASMNSDTLSLKYYHKALDEFLLMDHKLGIGKAHNNIAAILMDNLYDADSTLKHLEIAHRMFVETENIEGLAAVETNVGEILIRQKKYNLAKEKILHSIELFKKSKSLSGEAYAYFNLAKMYEETGDFTEAIIRLDSSEHISNQISYIESLSKIYKLRSEISQQQGQLQDAFLWFKKHHSYQLQMTEDMNKDKLTAIQREFEIKEKIENIQELKTRQRINQFIIAGVIIIFILIVWLGINEYKKQKEKVQKMEIIRKQEAMLSKVQQELAEEKIQRAEIEKKVLQNKVGIQTRKISSLSAGMVRKNEFLDKLKIEINSLYRLGDKAFHDKTRSIILDLHQNLEMDTDLEELKMQMNEHNQKFFQKLEQDYPMITKSERQLLGYLKHEIPTKTIASIMAISDSSVYTKRYRIRKKLQLKDEDSLLNFIQRLSDSVIIT